MKIFLVGLMSIFFCHSVIARDFYTSEVHFKLTEDSFAGPKKIAVKKAELRWTTDKSICELVVGKNIFPCQLEWFLNYTQFSFRENINQQLLSVLSKGEFNMPVDGFALEVREMTSNQIFQYHTENPAMSYSLHTEQKVWKKVN